MRPRAQTGLPLLLVLGACLGVSACLTREPVAIEPLEVTFEDQVSRRWHANGKRSSEEEVPVWSDGRYERHGRSRAWYQNGQLTYVRHYFLGKGVGRWQSWFESGALESEVDLADGQALASMKFYYESGQPAAMGEAIGGLRQGLWSYWHPNGQLAERGEYLDMNRVGVWERWTAEGQPILEPGATVPAGSQPQ